MERTISSNEKIRRAEEIYQRRRGQSYKENQARVNINGKDYKLLKKIFIQIAVCLLIYCIFYVIKNSNYIFSEDLLKHTKEVLSYDINFAEIYNNVKNSFTKDEPRENNMEAIVAETDIAEAVNDETENVNTKENVLEEKNENLQEEVQPITEESSISEALSDAEFIKLNYSLIKPLEGTITSRFGIRNPTTPTVPIYHTGIDIAADTGTKFIASMSGTVVQVSSEGDYGNHIKIKKDDIYTLYAHCSAIYVEEGDEINQGEEIGEVGETGNATGPHLHFEIRREDRYVNPDDVLVF